MHSRRDRLMIGRLQGYCSELSAGKPLASMEKACDLMGNQSEKPLPHVLFRGLPLGPQARFRAGFVVFTPCATDLISRDLARFPQFIHGRPNLVRNHEQGGGRPGSKRHPLKLTQAAHDVFVADAVTVFQVRKP